jgi:hypothetical protein
MATPARHNDAAPAAGAAGAAAAATSYQHPMKEHPILFSAPMILALLAGTKTQTRRIIKPQPEVSPAGNLVGEWLSRPLGGLLLPKVQDITLPSPFGQPGDRLWVRETCRAEELPDGTNGVRYLADNHFRLIDNTPEAAEQWVKLYHYGKRRGATIPPIHAPRWASRILLEKVAGRVEQVQDISEADAQAEGAVRGLLLPYGRDDWQLEHNIYATYKEGFQYIWYSVHSAASWEANPWVWVEQFQVLRP